MKSLAKAAQAYVAPQVAANKAISHAANTASRKGVSGKKAPQVRLPWAKGSYQMCDKVERNGHVYYENCKGYK